MSTPTHSITSRRGRLYIHPGTGRALPSVTNVTGMLNKPALPRWAAKETALYAVAQADTIAKLAQDDEGAAVDLLKGAPWRASGKKAEAGTNVHEAVEAWLTGAHRDDSPTEADHVEQFAAMWARMGFALRYAEAQVFNLGVGYAGSVDVIAEREGEVWVLDVKTGKGPYPEHALQLSAYAHAEQVARTDGTLEDMPAVTHAAVVDLKANRSRVIPTDIGAEVFRAFRAARVLWDLDGRVDLFGEAV